MRKLTIFFTTFIFAVTSFSSAQAQVFDPFYSDVSSLPLEGLINTGIEILHIDSNLAGTALIESGGVGYHLGGADSFDANPENSLWLAMAAILGTLGGNEDEILLTGEEAEEFLERLRAAERRGDITIRTTTTVTVSTPEDSGTVRLCVQTFFGCITIKKVP